MRPATQDWVHSLSIMQQSVLLTAIRGPDGVPKYHPCKYLLRWYRRCVLLSALDGKVLSTPYAYGGGSFTGPSYTPSSFDHDWRRKMDVVVDQYLQSLDELPHHYQMHFLHAAEIVGYKHPDHTIRPWWHALYVRLVKDLHLSPETQAELDFRLADNREQWLATADRATAE